MTTKKRGRENLIHQWGTPALPAVGTSQVPDFLTQEPPQPPPAAQREMPAAPITAQDPLAPQKLSRPQQKNKNSTKKKN
eukprot:15047083-Ditylum_brightwellii.AAC.1